MEFSKANLLCCYLFSFVQFASAKHILNAFQIYGIDAASGAAILALDVRPGDHVLDLCAAPGKLLYQYFLLEHCFLNVKWVQ